MSQAEHPERRAPLSRQVAIAVAALGLDAIACYFAAQALGSSQLQTGVYFLEVIINSNERMMVKLVKN